MFEKFDCSSSGMFNGKILWVVYFCYATFVALLFQKLLLPMMPSLHGGEGLLSTDSQYFHQIAINLADKIKTVGWSEWTIWPTYSSAGNVAILSILYVLFGPDPSLLIPVNAAVHATGGVMIYLISRNLFTGKTGYYTGVIASALFVFFPSSINWYGQLHKDGYAILGILIIVFTWVNWFQKIYSTKNLVLFVLYSLLGSSLLAFVRPNYMQLLLLVVTASWFIVSLVLIVRQRGVLINTVSGIAGILPVLLIYFLTTSADILDNNARYSNDEYTSKFLRGMKNESASLTCPFNTSWKWEKSKFLPSSVDKRFETVSILRAGFICSGYSAGSTLDKNTVPDSAFALLAYLPRGLQIALWAPFPDQWFHGFSLTRLTGWGETIIWYLLAPGIVLLLLHQRSIALFWVLSFIFLFLLIYGYVIPNVGTLHRLRYPFISLLMMSGIAGWNSLWLRNRSAVAKEVVNSEHHKTELNNEQGSDSNLLSRTKVVNTGLLVSFITASTFLLLFFRDILMSRWYGLGSELDAFYIAMMLPMFFVNILSIPLGSAVLPLYQKLHNNQNAAEAGKFISGFAFIAMGSLGGIAMLILLFSGILLSFLGWGFDAQRLFFAQEIIPYASAVLFLSGFVVLGNSILNAHQKFFLPAIAQMVVPIFAILSLIVLSDQIGIVSVALGMLLGQIVNLIMVLILLAKQGISLKPSMSASRKSFREGFPLYAALIAAAIFVNAVTVIDNAMASTLATGSVSAYSLGMKVVLFLTGVIGAGITTVMLPYFSSFFAAGQKIAGCRELAYYLMLGTLMTLPVGMVLFEFADEITEFVFHGGALNTTAVEMVGRVAAFGVIQLPFFTSHLLLMKFMNAHQRSKAVLLTGLLGLILNVILNVLLIGPLGVAGLALATTFSYFLTSLALVFLIYRDGYIDVVNMIYLGLLWILYLTVILCLYYASYAGVIVALIAMTFLLVDSRQKLSMNPV